MSKESSESPAAVGGIHNDLAVGNVCSVLRRRMYPFAAET